MNNEYHIYSIEWLIGSITILIDGKKYFEYHDTSNNLTWPFDKPQNLILNLAMGGGWGGGGMIADVLSGAELWAVTQGANLDIHYDGDTHERCC